MASLLVEFEVYVVPAWRAVRVTSAS